MNSTRIWIIVAAIAFPVVADLALYFAIRRASVSRLKSVLPWVNRALWVMWALMLAAVLRQMVMDKASLLTLAAYVLYFSLLPGPGWIKSRIRFADPPSWDAKRMGRLLHIPGHTYVEIDNPSTAANWYVKKLGLRRLAPSEDADPKTIRMKFSDVDEEMRLGPRDPLSLGGTVMLYSRRLKRANEVLRERGVEVGPIQVDRQGTSYFEFHDPEGNIIEVCGARVDG